MFMTADTFGGQRKKSISSLLVTADSLVASARAMLHVQDASFTRVGTIARRCSSLISPPSPPPEAHQRRRSVLPGIPMRANPRVSPNPPPDPNVSGFSRRMSTTTSREEGKAPEQQQEPEKSNKLRTSNLSRLAARIARRSSSVKTCDPEQARCESVGSNRWLARRASVATTVAISKSLRASEDEFANKSQPINFYTPTMMKLRARLRWDSKIR